jgi:hypothetical protein
MPDTPATQLDTEAVVRDMTTLLRTQPIESDTIRDKLARLLSGEEVDELYEHFARNLVQAWKVVGKVQRDSARRALFESICREF